MIIYYRKAIQDLTENRFLNTVTVITIALSILIVSTFALFSVNVNDIMGSWEKSVRIMAYLRPDTLPPDREKLETTIRAMEGVAGVRFISKAEALSILKKQTKSQPSLLEGLDENPLPDAFEIRLTAMPEFARAAENLASRIESLARVESTEYGRKWLGRFTNIVDLFQITAYAMGVLFFAATVFIVANTIRLVLYTRREEVEIMRLVGASDRFIKIPFYVEGAVQGAVGSVIGLIALFIAFVYLSSNVSQDFAPGFFRIRFLPAGAIVSIIGCSMGVGWLGCYLSLKQFLK